MKQGWEIKKLGDFIKEHSIRNKSGVEYPVYSVTNSQGFCKDYFSKEVASKEKRTYKIVPFGCFAYNPSRINVGSVDWQHCEENVIVSPLYVVFSISKDVMQGFLLRYLKSNFAMSLIDNFARGTVRANLKFDTLCSFPIAIPSREEQERIVEELDCLSGVIEKKREQLKQLDALAQSIFYQMFGDPITNEKGWKVKKLGEVCNKITDGTHNSPKSFPSGVYMYVTAKNIKKDGFDLSNITYVSEDVHKSIYSRCNPVFGDILYIKDGATTGIAMINSLKEEFSLLSSVALLKCNYDMVSNIFIKEVLNSTSKYNEIRGNMGGAAITRLTINKIENIYIPLPPLALQQEFADKIEAIEKQKELIKKSISETETLFNARMDYYFN